MKKRLLLLVSVLLCGCQTVSRPAPPEVALGAGLNWTLPSLSWVTEPVDKTQQVVAWHGDNRWQLVGQLSLHADKMTLTALSDFGTFLFQTSFDGRQFTARRSPLMPAKADTKHLLADLLMALMPEPALAKSLAPLGVKVETQHQQRLLRKNGQILVAISYHPKGFQFEQRQLGYGFKVTYE
ncbi:DUF3261 domain-containing protein [Gallaecimonas sp. GXIMD1310]|uniref:DUF3261 domain-containing protein n=1 Tax=Gallaecimonas sp. GXIMD1310 TaxID=3131926 RepID=UPI00324C7CD7